MNIKCDSISYLYKSQNGVKSFSAEFEGGNVYGLLGPNGSGKSTLLKMISGSLKPQSGVIYVNSKNLNSIKHKDRVPLISYLPQNIPCDFDYTCREAVSFGRFAYSGFIPDRSEYEICSSAMKKMGIDAFADRRVSQLSGGEFQRVMIAQATAQQAEAMLLDEPISHLDISYQVEIMNYLSKKAKEENILVIISLHDLNIAAYFCDYAFFMKSGNLAAKGKIKEALSESAVMDVFGVKAEIIEYSGKKIPVVKKV